MEAGKKKKRKDRPQRQAGRGSFGDRNRAPRRHVRKRDRGFATTFPALILALDLDPEHAPFEAFVRRSYKDTSQYFDTSHSHHESPSRFRTTGEALYRDRSIHFIFPRVQIQDSTEWMQESRATWLRNSRHHNCSDWQHPGAYKPASLSLTTHKTTCLLSTLFERHDHLDSTDYRDHGGRCSRSDRHR